MSSCLSSTSCAGYNVPVWDHDYLRDLLHERELPRSQLGGKRNGLSPFDSGRPSRSYSFSADKQTVFGLTGFSGSGQNECQKQQNWRLFSVVLAYQITFGISKCVHFYSEFYNFESPEFRVKQNLYERSEISISNGKLTVPDNPTIPFIEGDGTGVDIWPASRHVFDKAVEKAYGGKRKDQLERSAGR